MLCIMIFICAVKMTTGSGDMDIDPIQDKMPLLFMVSFFQLVTFTTTLSTQYPGSGIWSWFSFTNNKVSLMTTFSFWTTAQLQPISVGYWKKLRLPKFKNIGCITSQAGRQEILTHHDPCFLYKQF